LINSYQISDTKSKIKLISLLLCSTLTVMAGATIAPSLPGMSLVFQDHPNSVILVKLTLSFPALFIAITSPIIGIVIDKWKRKPILLISTVIYAIAGSSGYFLSSLNEILIGRAFLGIAVGGIMTTTTTLIADYFTGEKRNRVIGMQGAFMSFGGVLFLLSGGFLADIDWKAPFLIYLFSLIILPLVSYSIKEPNILRNKQKNKESIFKIRLVYLIYPIAVFTMITFFFLVPIQMPFFLKDMTGASNSEVGIAISSVTLFAAFTALSYNHVKSKLSFQNIFALIFVLMGIGYSIISVSESYIQTVIGLIIFGLGFGLLLPNMNLWLVSVTPDLLRGSVVGGLVSFIFLGQFLSPLVGQPFLEIFGMNTTYGIAGIAMLVLFSIFMGYSTSRMLNKIPFSRTEHTT
jgi:MFS family permease